MFEHTASISGATHNVKSNELCKCRNSKLIWIVGRLFVIAFQKVRRTPYLFQSHVTKWIPHERRRKREWFVYRMTVVLLQNECANCDSMMLINNLNDNIPLSRNSQVEKHTTKRWSEEKNPCRSTIQLSSSHFKPLSFHRVWLNWVNIPADSHRSAARPIKVNKTNVLLSLSMHHPNDQLIHNSKKVISKPVA